MKNEMSIQHHVAEQAKVVADVGAAAVTISVIMDWAPAVAAVFTALYAIFRLYEAVDKHFQSRKNDKRWPYSKAD